MFLKYLEVQGFKSFPDKERIEFNKGIIGIEVLTEVVRVIFLMPSGGLWANKVLRVFVAAKWKT